IYPPILLIESATTNTYTLSLHDALPIFSLTYWQALHLCWDRGYYGVSVLTGLVGFWFPLLQIALTLWVMQAIAARRLPPDLGRRSEEHTSELQSRENLVCRLLLEQTKRY